MIKIKIIHLLYLLMVLLCPLAVVFFLIHLAWSMAGTWMDYINNKVTENEWTNIS